MVDTKKEPVRGKPAAGFSALVLRGNDSKLLDGVLDAAPDGNLAKSGFPTAWFDVGDFPPVLDDFAIEFWSAAKRLSSDAIFIQKSLYPSIK